MAQMTMAEAIKFSNASEISKAIMAKFNMVAQVFATIPSRPINGKRIPKFTVTAPTTGFRAENTGFDPTFTAVSKDTEQCYALGGYSPLDRMSIMEAKSAGLSKEDFIRSQILGLVGSSSGKADTQFFYGDSGSDNGYDGLFKRVSKDGDYFVDAGGRTDPDGGLTSIYFAYFGEGFAEGLWGDGKIIGESSVSVSEEMNLKDADNKAYRGHEVQLECYPGVAYYQSRAIAQLGNITTTVADHKATVDLLDSLLERVAYRDFDQTLCRIYMNYTAFGHIKPAVGTDIVYQTVEEFGRDDLKYPHFRGIPVIITPKVLNTETNKIPAA